MLPSSGFFKSIYCVYYQLGLCERPHCHFKHAKTDSAPTARIAAPSESEGVGNKSEMLDSVNKAIIKIKEDLLQVQQQSSTSYVPTPVSLCPNRQQVQQPPEQKRYIPAQSVPQYRPTPLSELRKLQELQNGVVSSSYPLKRRANDVPKETYVPKAVKLSPEETVSVKRMSPKFSSDEEDYKEGTDNVKSVDNDVKVDDIKDVEQEDGLDQSDVKRDSKSNSSPEEDLEQKNIEEIDSWEINDAGDEMHLNEESNEDGSEKCVGDDVLKNKDDSSEHKHGDCKHNSHRNKESSGSSKSKHGTDKLDKSNKHSGSRTSKSQSSKESSNKESSTSKSDRTSKQLSSSKHKHHKKSSEQSSHSKDNHLDSSSRKSDDKSTESHNKENESKLKSSSSASSLTSESSSEEPVEKKMKTPSKPSSEKEHGKKSSDKVLKHKPNSSKSENNLEKPSSHSSKLHSNKKNDKTSNSHHKSSGHRSSDRDNRHHRHSHSKSSHSSTRKSLSSKESSKRENSHSSSKEKKNSSSSSSRSNHESHKKSHSLSKSHEKESSKKDSSVRKTTKNDIEVNDTYSDVDFGGFDTDLDEHDTDEECLRIFNESIVEQEPPKPVERVSPVEAKESEVPAYVPVKQRIAHDPGLQRSVKSSGPVISSAAKVMHSRYMLMMQKKLASGENSVSRTETLSKTAPSSLNTSDTVGKPSTFTVATLPKGAKRVAHIPAVTLSKRPSIPTEYGSKVPTNVRQRYLNLIIDEYIKICSTEDEAFQKALEEEQNAYNRSSNKTVYLNVAVNLLKRLRRETENAAQVKSSPAPSSNKPNINVPKNRVMSHAALLRGPKAASFSIGTKAKPKELELTEDVLYQYMKQYLLTEDELKSFGYPQPHPKEPGKAVFHLSDPKKYCDMSSLTRVCCRCQARYFVTKKGEHVRKEDCVYHDGRLWKKRIAGSIESRYNCCNSDAESEGCQVSPYHVQEGFDPNTWHGFVKTLPKALPSGKSYGVYSLDCEMSYTTVGLELTRVTVINKDLKPIYETLVCPENPVLDYNTKFSGIKDGDLDGVKTSLRDVQAVLLSIFNDKTILIGHSLESDLKALKLIHSYVVDTSAVFPHRLGLPYKRALRTLMAEFLNKIIQSEAGGHDSQEDASACMELMIMKIKEDIKKEHLVPV